MGLDTTHDAFSGAYSAFNRFRQVVAKAAGGSYPPHDDPKLDEEMWFVGDGFSSETHPGLFEFLNHSDCDGDIAPEVCAKLADEMEALLPKIESFGEGVGHIERAGGYGGVTRRWIAGCREAAAANEPLEFF